MDIYALLFCKYPSQATSTLVNSSKYEYLYAKNNTRYHLMNITLELKYILNHLTSLPKFVKVFTKMFYGNNI